MKSIHVAAYIAIVLSFARKIMAIPLRSPERIREVPREFLPEPRYTVFAIPDSGHRCLVADVYSELTSDEMDDIERRLRGVLNGMAVFARYSPSFARGCGPQVDLFTITSGKHIDTFTLEMASGARRAIMCVIPPENFRIL